MRSTVLFSVGVFTVFAVSAGAQTAVLPLSAQTVAGNNSNAFPWGSAATSFPGLRIMCLYDSTHFTNATSPISYPIRITHVRWRANDVSVATTWTGGMYTTASLSLATAAVDHAAASTAWASNCSGDYNTVYNGPVFVLGGAGAGIGVPGPIVVDIALTTPFLYDPNAGDLVVDTNVLPGAWTGGTFVALDVMTTNGLARRVFSSTLYPTANAVDTLVPVIEVEFVPAGSGTPALNTTLGAGCVSAADVSSYENFPLSASFDLANSSISMIRTSSGYLALPGFTTYVPPSATAQVLPLTDDSEYTVTLSQPMPVSASSSTSQLTVCSNGFISAGTGNGTSFTPSPPTFLAGAQMWWSLCWHDYNPSTVGGGQIKFQQIGTIAYVTWDGVWDFGGASPANANTMQAQFEVTTGTVHFVYGTMSANGNGRLVGISDAGASQDPGSMDISAALPATYNALLFAVQPMALAGVTRPILGTNWNFAVTRVPPAGTVGIEVFGVTDPGINDLSFLGMPTCGLRASLDVLNAWIVTGISHPYGIAVPNNQALVNSHVFTTAVVLQPGVNPFGAITSNGIDGRIGDF